MKNCLRSLFSALLISQFILVTPVAFAQDNTGVAAETAQLVNSDAADKAAKAKMWAGLAINLVSVAVPLMCPNFFKVPSALVFFAGTVTNIIGEISNSKKFAGDLTAISNSTADATDQQAFYKAQIEVELKKLSAAKKRKTFQGLTSIFTSAAAVVAVIEGIAEAEGADFSCVSASKGGKAMSTILPYLQMLMGGAKALTSSYRPQNFFEHLDYMNYLSGNKSSLTIDEYYQMTSMIDQDMQKLILSAFSALSVANAQAAENPVKSGDFSGTDGVVRNNSMKGLEKTTSGLSETFENLIHSPYTRAVLFGIAGGLSTTATIAMEKEIKVIKNNISILERRAGITGSGEPEVDTAQGCLNSSASIDLDCQCKKTNTCYKFTFPSTNVKFPTQVQKDLDSLISSSNSAANGITKSSFDDPVQTATNYQDNLLAMNSQLNDQLKKSGKGTNDIAKDMAALEKDILASVPDSLIKSSTTSYRVKSIADNSPKSSTENFDFGSLFNNQPIIEAGPKTGIVYGSAEALQGYNIPTNDIAEDTETGLFKKVTDRYQQSAVKRLQK